MLRPGVDHYRRFLQERVQEADVQLEVLQSRYIPNVTGKPFQLQQDYVQEVIQLTGSSVLQEWIATAVH